MILYDNNELKTMSLVIWRIYFFDLFLLLLLEDHDGKDSTIHATCEMLGPLYQQGDDVIAGIRCVDLISSLPPSASLEHQHHHGSSSGWISKVNHYGKNCGR
jgi:hypothetical protein